MEFLERFPPIEQPDVSTSEDDFREIEAAAAAGEVVEQRRLGQCYLYGRGTAKDPEQALYWLKKAAEAGDHISCYELSMYHFRNKDGDRLTAEQLFLAVRWAKKVIEFGGVPNALQRYLIAEQLLKDPSGKNLAQAIEHLQIAAEQDFSFAQFKLAQCYHMGKYLPKDMEKALQLYRRAAELGSKAAKLALIVIERSSREET